MNILYLDLATAGTVQFGAQWETDYLTIPEVTEVGWIYNGFSYVTDATKVPALIDDSYDADLLIGCDLHRKISAIKAQIIRDYGMEFYEEMGVGEALDKRKRIDLALSAKNWAAMYGADGKLHTPTIYELFYRCYPGAGYATTSYKSRPDLIAFCTYRLLAEGLIELKQRPD